MSIAAKMSPEEMSPKEKRFVLDVFLNETLRMAKLSGALVEATEVEHGGWCIQFDGNDPQLISRGNAIMLAYGFRLGTKHYHDYKRAQGEIAAIRAEDEVEQGADA